MTAAEVPAVLVAPLPSPLNTCTFVAAAEVPAVPVAPLPSLLHTCTFVAAAEVPAVPVAPLPSPLHSFAPIGRLKNRRRRLMYCCFL